MTRDSPGRGLGRREAAAAILLAWVLSLAFDLFLHAGALAALYVEPSPFLLPPEEAFRRIPFGYLAFLVLTVSLYWLLTRMGVRSRLEGLRLGLSGGLVVWGALAVGLYSISTAQAGLLVGWWVGQAVELGLAGAVMGSVLGGRPLRKVALEVAAAALLLSVATVVLQSTGLAPTPGR